MKGIVLLVVVAACGASPHSAGGPPGTVAPNVARPPAAGRERPVIPPLLPDEKPPTDTPNFFAADLSSGGIMVGVHDCVEAATRDEAMDEPFANRYCICMIDLWRARFRMNGGDFQQAIPTFEGLRDCADYARAEQPPPFAYAWPRDVHTIVRLEKNCWVKAKRTHADIYVYMCACTTDLALSGGERLVVDENESKRCEIAARYYETTRRHLTIRQFKGIAVP